MILAQPFRNYNYLFLFVLVSLSVVLLLSGYFNFEYYYKKRSRSIEKVSPKGHKFFDIGSSFCHRIYNTI